MNHSMLIIDLDDCSDDYHENEDYIVHDDYEDLVSDSDDFDVHDDNKDEFENDDNGYDDIYDEPEDGDGDGDESEVDNSDDEGDHIDDSEVIDIKNSHPKSQVLRCIMKGAYKCDDQEIKRLLGNIKSDYSDMEDSYHGDDNSVEPSKIKLIMKKETSVDIAKDVKRSLPNEGRDALTMEITKKRQKTYK